MLLNVLSSIIYSSKTVEEDSNVVKDYKISHIKLRLGKSVIFSFIYFISCVFLNILIVLRNNTFRQESMEFKKWASK